MGLPLRTPDFDYRGRKEEKRLSSPHANHWEHTLAVLEVRGGGQVLAIDGKGLVACRS
jgi:hypothetical protein